MNELKADQTSASSSWGKWGEILKGIIAPSLAIIPQRLGETKQKMDEIAKRTTEEGEQLDFHVKLFEQQGAEQERLGLLIRRPVDRRVRQLQAKGHAQEARRKNDDRDHPARGQGAQRRVCADAGTSRKS